MRTVREYDRKRRITGYQGSRPIRRSSVFLRKKDTVRVTADVHLLLFLPLSQRLPLLLLPKEIVPLFGAFLCFFRLAAEVSFRQIAFLLHRFVFLFLTE